MVELLVESLQREPLHGVAAHFLEEGCLADCLCWPAAIPESVPVALQFSHSVL